MDIGGGTLCPAALFFQRFGAQIHIQYEIVPFKKDQVGVEEFCNAVLACERAHYAESEVYYFADPAASIQNASDVALRTTFDLMLSYNIRAEPAPINIHDTAGLREPVRRLLTKLQGGQPCLMVDSKCEALIEALEGGYCYEEKKTRRRFDWHANPTKKHPDSDVADALMYGLIGSGEEQTTEILIEAAYERHGARQGARVGKLSDRPPQPKARAQDDGESGKEEARGEGLDRRAKNRLGFARLLPIQQKDRIAMNNPNEQPPAAAQPPTKTKTDRFLTRS